MTYEGPESGALEWLGGTGKDKDIVGSGQCDHPPEKRSVTTFSSAAAPAGPCDHISRERRHRRRGCNHISFATPGSDEHAESKPLSARAAYGPLVSLSRPGMDAMPRSPFAQSPAADCAAPA